MNTVRTTISLEENLHKQLLTQAFSMGKSLSEVVNSRLKNSNSVKVLATSQIESDMALFARLGKKVGKTNWAKQIRLERERDS